GVICPASLRRAARLHAQSGQCRRGGADLHPARRTAVGHRVGRRPAARPAGGADRRVAVGSFRVVAPWPARCARPPAHPGRLYRVVADLSYNVEQLQFLLTGNPAVALQMTINVRSFWFLRGMLSETRRWLDLTLSATAPTPTHLRVLALHYVAATAVVQGDAP